MKCLIIGSGGREHALAWKIAQSSEIHRLYVAPGNAGTAKIAKNIPIPADEINSLLSFADKERINLTVVGPETPLAKGVVNLFQKAGLPIFGPNQAAARLETSKIFAKEFMVRHRIPTAEFRIVASLSEGRSILKKWGGKPAVIKVDGLAAGKGAFICDTQPEKEEALKQIFSRKIFKSAGKKAIIEEKLNGEEVSLLAITDGKKYHCFPSAQDHKKIGENDIGPNTGGMGAVAPNPFLLPSVRRQVIRDVVAKTISGLAGFLTCIILSWSIASFSLIALQLGNDAIQKVPVWHCQSILAALAYMHFDSILIAGFVGIGAIFLQDLMGRMFWNHGSNHVDPPACAIATGTFILNNINRLT